jgi:multidrug resistance efflux pump
MMILAATVGLGLMLATAQQETRSDQPEAAEATTADLRKTIDLEGSLVPADAAEISLWLERYRGELLVLEVVAHGDFVNDGDVLIRFDTRAIDEQIRQAEFDLVQARQKLENTERENAIQEEAVQADLSRTEKEAEWSARKLGAYLEKEKAFKEEEIRLRNQSWQHNLEDQRDELEQLEQMYREDELVDATEEIVLKRSRRRLATSKANTKLREQQNEHALAHSEAIKQEGLEQDAALKAAALDRQRRSAVIKRANRDADLERARFDLDKKQVHLDGLQRDRQRLEVRAPRRGLALHGDAEAAPGKATIERGGRVSLHNTFMVVAAPDQLKVVTEVPEASLFEAKTGTAAEVTLVAAPDLKLIGALKVSFLPTNQVGKDGNVYRAEIELTGKDTRLRPGMRCNIAVIVSEADDVALGTGKAGVR